MFEKREEERAGGSLPWVGLLDDQRGESTHLKDGSAVSLKVLFYVSFFCPEMRCSFFDGIMCMFTQITSTPAQDVDQGIDTIPYEKV